jgi:hypothetical protein
MKSIPFSVPEVYEGLAETDGLARFDGTALWLEYQTKDAIVGLLKSGVKQVALRPTDLESVALKHRMFRSYLTLRARSLAAVEQLPGTRGPEIKLRFKRQYRPELNDIASALSVAISEAMLARLEDESDWLDR